MEFTELTTARYSCKKYDQTKKVSQEQLDAILEAGHQAPTAKNLQPQRVYVIQSGEGLAKVDQVTPCRYGAQTVLMVAWDGSNLFTYPGGERDTGIEDASIIATHLMLAAKNAGVDSCWINNFNPAEAKKTFELPENEEVLMFLDLGFAAEGSGPLPNHTKRKDLTDTVTYL